MSSPSTDSSNSGDSGDSSPSRSARAVLIVLDGFGLGPGSKCNAIENARMPFYRDLVAKYPHSQLLTHGEAVGLPPGVMGNSEVGHMTMGAGRIIYQDLTRISKSIHDGDFSRNPALRATLETGARSRGRVHLMGLLSDGGVHSHLDHLLALLDLCLELQIPEVSVHAFLDGRDTPPDSSPKYVERLLRHPTFSRPAGQTRAVIASIGGRYYAMDRDTRWERVAEAYRVLTGQTDEVAFSGPGAPALQAIARSHADGKSDEFVKPVLLANPGLPPGDAAMRDGDSVVFFNYRSDRAREISRALTGAEFDSFDRGRGFKPSAYCGMAEYDKNLKSVRFAFGPQNFDHLFGEWLEERDLLQFRVAETEKYAHVTFFFNGGREKPYRGEERTLIPSPKDVATYDLKPEMSARQVAETAAAQIALKKHHFVLMNFANADMVGHTGNYEAAVRAVETLDGCLARVVGEAQRADYHVLLTADHGNAEEMCDAEGKIHTQHTLNPVPAIWIEPGSAIAPRSSRRALRDGTLADVMPTLCELMRLPLPPEATGKSLLPT